MTSLPPSGDDLECGSLAPDGAAAPGSAPVPADQASPDAAARERRNLIAALSCAIGLAETAERAGQFDGVDRAFLDKCRRTLAAALARGEGQ